MIPAPTPVPRVTMIELLLPLAAPTRASPRAAALASFAIYTLEMGRYFLKISAIGKFLKGRLLAYSTIPSLLFAIPGVAIPTY
jgi:hypothetical protein